MSASKHKGKSEKDDWKECLSCSMLICNRDIASHENCCVNYHLPILGCERLLGFSSTPTRLSNRTPNWNNLRERNSQNLSKSFEKTVNEPDTHSPKTTLGTSHGFCLQNNLYGQCSPIPNKCDEMKNIPHSIQHGVILLHPSAMRLCGIGIGDYVLVTSAANLEQSLAYAWPSLSGHPASIRLQNPPWKSDQWVKVQLYPLPVIPASLLILETAEDLNDQFKDKLVNVILVQLCNLSVMTGSKCSVNFFGRQVRVQVKFVSGTSNEKLDDIDVNVIANLEKTFDNSCSLNDSYSESEDIPHLNLSMSPSKGFKQAFITPRKQVLENSLRDDLPQFYRVSYETKVMFKEKPILAKSSEKNPVTYESIGGLDGEIANVKDILNLVFQFPSKMTDFGLSLPKGLILFGPSGTGKTLLYQAMQHEEDFNFISISGPDIFSKYYGETESKLKQLFEEAKAKGPSIIFLDDIDILCPKREKSSDQAKRFLNALTLLIDNIQPESDKIFILGASNCLEDLDLALRRPGRLDKTLEIPVPSPKARINILGKLLKKVKHSLLPEDITRVAENAHSFTGGDLALMVREAVQTQLQKSLSRNSEPLNVDQLEICAKSIRPSAMKEVTIEVPKVRWSDIGGQESLKLKLLQSVQWPLKNPEAFQRLGIKPPHGLLMYGPPGCSKTLIAKALATESGLNFFAIKGPELFNKWVGESERAVREVFRKARAAAPSIVFFDELDALAAERTGTQGASGVGNRVLAQLLNEMDGVEALQGVTVVAATNRPDMIDKALLRPGRLDRIVYVPLPDQDTRREILRIQTLNMPLADNVDLETLVAKTDGYSGAEVVGMCQEAGLMALSENLNAETIGEKHFQQALLLVRPRTDPQRIIFYQEYHNQSTLFHS